MYGASRSPFWPKLQRPRFAYSDRGVRDCAPVWIRKRETLFHDERRRSRPAQQLSVELVRRRARPLARHELSLVMSRSAVADSVPRQDREDSHLRRSPQARLQARTFGPAP